MPHEALKEAPFSEGADINSVGNTQVMHTQPTNPVFPVPEDSRGLDTSVSNAEVRTTAAEGCIQSKLCIDETTVELANYEVAATLCDSLKSFEEEELVLCLRALMKEAVVNDKLEAARLRDSLKSFKEEEPVLCLRGLMNEAVVNDKFEVGLDLCYLDEAPLEDITHIEVINKRIPADWILKTRSLLSDGCIS
ncbi:hypothetical protein Tco_0723851 [Tanacetum coccineum]